MLPNHAPLMVMERFKVLEALFPGPDRSRARARAGHRPGHLAGAAAPAGRRDDDDFLERFQEMMLFESNGFPANHPFAKVAAMPTGVPLPPIWLLGSSGYSAELAAHVGAGFSFAHHFSDFPPDGPMLELPQPVQAVGLAPDALCDPRRRGDRAPIPRPRRTGWRRAPTCISCAAPGANTVRSPRPRRPPPIPTRRSTAQRIEHNRKRLIVGTPAQVHERIQALSTPPRPTR